MTKLSQDNFEEFRLKIADEKTSNKYYFVQKNEADFTIAYLYHSNCNDGFVAAGTVAYYSIYNPSIIELTTKSATGNSVFVSVQYGDEPPLLPADTKQIVVLDFSFDEDALMAAYPGMAVIQLDHHETAKNRISCRQCGEEEVCEQMNGALIFRKGQTFATIIAEQESGASLAFSHCTGVSCEISSEAIVHFGSSISIPAMFAALAKDRDLWTFKYGDITKAARVYLLHKYPDSNILQYASDINDLVKNVEVNNNFVYKEISKFIPVVQAEELRLASLTKKVELFEDSDNRLAGMCLYTGKDASDLADSILKANEELQYVIMYTLASDICLFNIRSKNGTAISVAEKLGGGGHANAAGAKVDASVLFDTYYPLIKLYKDKQS